MKAAGNLPTRVEEYLTTVPGDVRKALQALRKTIKVSVPGIEERIAYRIPVFRLQRDLVGFSAKRNPQKRICSFYMMSPALAKELRIDLQDYKVSGATIHFTPEKPLPAALVRKILHARLEESLEKF